MHMTSQSRPNTQICGLCSERSCLVDLLLRNGWHSISGVKALTSVTSGVFSVSPSQGTSIFVRHVNYKSAKHYKRIILYSHLFIQNHLHVVRYSHKVYGFQAEGQCDIAPYANHLVI